MSRRDQRGIGYPPPCTYGAAHEGHDDLTNEDKDVSPRHFPMCFFKERHKHRRLSSLHSKMGTVCDRRGQHGGSGSGRTARRWKKLPRHKDV